MDTASFWLNHFFILFMAIQTAISAGGRTGAVVAPAPPPTFQTWFVRADGGVRYDATYVPSGQCDGKSDSAYPGSGVNQHCAFNDVRYFWSTNTNPPSGQGTWIIAGGDTIVIRGCAALGSQANPDNPHCRMGFDSTTTGNPPNAWCYGVGPYQCYNPPIPAGTSLKHTQILGGCAYGTYTCTPINNNYPYGTTNETQIFGGMAMDAVFNMSSTNYVDVEGIEFTTHNGVCVTSGSPAYPRNCSTNPPYDDFAKNGLLFNNSSSHILLQDVYIHGLESSAMWGPIGPGIVLTRVAMVVNAADAWNLDDGADTANGAGATLDMTYVTAIGNGCHEQYPIISANAAFPAKSCYDSISNSPGGDTLSGQDSQLDRLTCDHCLMKYNTKDSWIGPHTQVLAQSIINSFSYGNMGAQWKWGRALNSTLTFQNNLTVTNCLRMVEAIPGAAQNFSQSTGLGGSYLTNFCRAGGAGFANVNRAGSTSYYYGNTVIAAGNIVFQEACGYYTIGNVFHGENCSTAVNNIKDNNFLGYTDPNPILGQPSALYYPLNADQSTSNNPSNTGVAFAGFYNNEFGLKSGTVDVCGSNNNTCVNPLMTSQPTTPWPGNETSLDTYNALGGAGNSFYPTVGSPLKFAGTTLGGLGLDYYASVRTSPPTLGGVQ